MTITDNDSLMDAIEKGDVKIPKDLNSIEDYSSWSRNINTMPFSREGILKALKAVKKDSNGIIQDELKTASRTFFKGSTEEEIMEWIISVF